MNGFLNDLNRATDSAASELRKYVKSFEDKKLYREQSTEALFVAETYYNLRKNGYSPETLFMEFMYDPVLIDGKNRKLKPDLIFEQGGKDQVVEVKVFWDGDLEDESSSLTPGALRVVDRYYRKMLLYPKLKKQVSDLHLVFAYVGPESFKKAKDFNYEEYSASIDHRIELLRKKYGKINIPINVVKS